MTRSAPVARSADPVEVPLPVSPLDRLQQLQATGSLGARYSQVAPLLAEVVGQGGGCNGVVRAGQLLGREDVDELVRAAQVAGTALSTITVAATGHSTLGQLTAPLTAELARHGLLLRPRPGDFDAYLRDLQDPTSALHGDDVDLALCVLDPQIVLDELPAPWTVDDLEHVAVGKLRQLELLATRFTGRAAARLVLNTVPLQRAVTHQLVSTADRARAGIVWREFNCGLLRIAERVERVTVLDLDPLVSDGGPVRETRLAVYAKVNLGEELLAAYAREVGHLARAVTGRSKKVLVVDLDNTMWDGVLGDDGPEGISAASTFRGEAFGAFQRLVQQIASQGVLLAASSKNYQDLVLTVLRDHPDMVVHESDFAVVRANWEPKDGNMRLIAQRLNLGTDSMVFADDSSFECGLVTASLPEVAVVPLDDEPALHVERLLADGWFDVLQITQEDRGRTQQYRTDAAREGLLEGAESYESYLEQLGVRVSLTRVTEQELPRVAQLTMRTNQFNLTTERLDATELGRRAADPDRQVLAIRSADRFGDNGVVGAVFTCWAGGGLVVENVLLSCRVFSRGIEQAALAAVLADASARGATSVTGTWRRTKKNSRVADFYASLGFAVTERTDDAASFRHDLADLPPVPTHLTLTTDLETT